MAYLAVFAFGVWLQDISTGIRIHFYSLHMAFNYLHHITTLVGNSSRKNIARRLDIRITIPYWAETLHGRTKHGVCFSSFSFIFPLLRLLLRSTTLPSHISRAASLLVAFAALRLSDANAVACSSSPTLSTRPLDVKGAIINTETEEEKTNQKIQDKTFITSCSAVTSILVSPQTD